jgi:pimeloyl-ACP methyl ester carboxylesterase
MSQDTPLVLVHGVPETEAVWGPLVTDLGRRDLTRLSPPGFGAAIPPGFGCTVSEYRDWLIEQLEAFDEPVDLIGHDWGGGHVVNVAMTRPDLLRSWATDAIGRIGRPVADELAAGQDEEMGRAILALYRSTARPHSR